MPFIPLNESAESSTPVARRSGFTPLEEPQGEPGRLVEVGTGLPPEPKPAASAGGGGIVSFIRDLLPKVAGKARDIVMPGLPLVREAMGTETVRDQPTTADKILGMEPYRTIAPVDRKPTPSMIGPVTGEQYEIQPATVENAVKQIPGAFARGAGKMAVEYGKLGNILTGDLEGADLKDRALKEIAKDELKARAASGDAGAVDAAAGLPQSLGYIAAFMSGGIPLAMLATQNKVVDQYAKHRTNGMKPLEAFAASQGSAAAEVIPERIGWEFLTQLFKLPATATKAQLLRAIGVQQFGEQTEEQITNAADYAIDRMMKDPTATPERLRNDIIQTAQQTAYLAPVLGGGAVAARATAPLVRKVEELVAPQRALGRAMQETLDDRTIKPGTPLVSALRRELDATQSGQQPAGDRGEYPRAPSLIPSDGEDRNVNPAVESRRAEAGRGDRDVESRPATPLEPDLNEEEIPDHAFEDPELEGQPFFATRLVDRNSSATLTDAGFKKRYGKAPAEMTAEEYEAAVLPDVEKLYPSQPKAWIKAQVRANWERAQRRAGPRAFNTEMSMDYFEGFKNATGKYPWQMPFEQFFKFTAGKLKSAVPGKSPQWYQGVIRNEWEKAKQFGGPRSFNTQTIDIPRSMTPLDAEETAVEDEARKMVQDDLEGLVKEYRSRFANEINPDNARELFPGYLKNPNRMAPAVHEPSSYIAKEVYRRILAEHGGENPLALFTSGGSGAGKTGAIRGHETMRHMRHVSNVIYDSNMNNFDSAKKKIDQALKAGRRVAFVYVYRDPIDSMRNGVLPRAMDVAKSHGRTVLASVHKATHEGAPIAARQLMEHYKDQPVDFVGLDNSRGRNNQEVVPIEELLNKPTAVSIKEIEDAVHAAARWRTSQAARCHWPSAARPLSLARS